eukprot:gene51051-39430_t
MLVRVSFEACIPWGLLLTEDALELRGWAKGSIAAAHADALTPCL